MAALHMQVVEVWAPFAELIGQDALCGMSAAALSASHEQPQPVRDRSRGQIRHLSRDTCRLLHFVKKDVWRSHQPKGA
jgi:hypothetical protein